METELAIPSSHWIIKGWRYGITYHVTPCITERRQHISHLYACVCVTAIEFSMHELSTFRATSCSMMISFQLISTVNLSPQLHMFMGSILGPCLAKSGINCLGISVIKAAHADNLESAWKIIEWFNLQSTTHQFTFISPLSWISYYSL